MSQHRWKLATLALIAIIGVIAGAVYAAHHGDAEVRVATMRHSDGSVEVAVQQTRRRRQLGRTPTPIRRATWNLAWSANGESPRRSLSPSPWPTTPWQDDAMQDDSMPDVSMPDAPAELYCIIHHGSATDPFWFAFNQAANGSAAALGLTNLEVKGGAGRGRARRRD